MPHPGVVLPPTTQSGVVLATGKDGSYYASVVNVSFFTVVTPSHSDMVLPPAGVALATGQYGESIMFL